MAFYPVNKRVYVANKQSGQVVSFLLGQNGFSRPIVSFSAAVISQAQSLAIDSSVYVLGNGTVSKFFAGSPAAFSFPQLNSPLSGAGKVYTQANFKLVYVLDPGNNRILVMDKNGNLEETLKSEQFTKMTDMAVDESNKILYVLDEGSLLKVALP